MLMKSVAVLTFLGLMTSVKCGYVHKLYTTNRVNRSWACGICDSMGGNLARRPVLDDWEIIFANLSHLDTQDYWLDLVKTDANEWYWGDGQPLNLTLFSSLPMTPAYNQTYTNWTCAIWNMGEPFVMPAACSEMANVICEVPTTEEECIMSTLGSIKFNDSTPGLTTLTLTVTYANCSTTCHKDVQCWAADYNNVTGECRVLLNSSRPAVPSMTLDVKYAVFGKTCVKYREMSPEDSNFICNCAAKTPPETEEEIKKFVEDYKEEVKKELVVPKDTLGATVRKKVSVPDERKSSTGIGALGIAMMAIVFGGLILLDITTVFAHFKMAANNVREVFTAERDSSDA